MDCLSVYPDQPISLIPRVFLLNYGTSRIRLQEEDVVYFFPPWKLSAGTWKSPRTEKENHPNLTSVTLGFQPFDFPGGDNFMGINLTGKTQRINWWVWPRISACSHFSGGKAKDLPAVHPGEDLLDFNEPKKAKGDVKWWKNYNRRGVIWIPSKHISPMERGKLIFPTTLGSISFWEGEGWGYIFGSFFRTWSWCWCFKTVAVRFHIHMTGCVCVMPLQIENIGEKPLKEANTLLSQLIKTIELKRCVCFLAYQDFLS